MATNPQHVRSLRRRLFATLIDYVLASLVFSVLLWPIASKLDSPFRITSGAIHWSACGQGSVNAPDGTPLSMEGWTSVAVCDSYMNIFFPSRTAVFTHSITEGPATYYQSVELALDGQNRVAVVYNLDWIGTLLLIVLAAIFEASRLGATPGKLIMGLRVVRPDWERVGLFRAFLRNSVKYLGLTITAIFGIFAMFFASWPLSLIENGNRVVFPDEELNTLIYLGSGLIVLAAILCLVIIASMVLPWRTAGRGFYDRWAGTLVVK